MSTPVRKWKIGHKNLLVCAEEKESVDSMTMKHSHTAAGTQALHSCCRCVRNVVFVKWRVPNSSRDEIVALTADSGSWNELATIPIIVWPGIFDSAEAAGSLTKVSA
jgi:hypothetical protein